MLGQGKWAEGFFQKNLNHAELVVTAFCRTSYSEVLEHHSFKHKEMRNGVIRLVLREHKLGFLNSRCYRAVVEQVAAENNTLAQVRAQTRAAA